MGDHWHAIQIAAGERHSLILAQSQLPLSFFNSFQSNFFTVHISVITEFTEEMNVVKVFAMGSNEYGQCGVSRKIQSEAKDQTSEMLVLTPHEVHSPSSEDDPTVKIACGALHSLLLTKSGRVFSFGWNGYRQCKASQQMIKFFVLDLVMLQASICEFCFSGSRRH